MPADEAARPPRADSSTGTSRRTCWSAASSPSVASAPSGVTPLNSNSHSMSCRGRPVHAQIRCLTSTCARRVGVAELERRQQAGDRRVPGQLPLVDQLGEHQRRQRLGVRRDHEERVGVDLLVAPSSRTPKPPANTTLPSWTRPMATPGTPVVLHRRLDEPAQLGDPRLIEPVRLLPGERSRACSPWAAAGRRSGDLGAALLADVLRHVVDDDRPHRRRRAARLRPTSRFSLGDV